jgi:NAD(P)-dependent dehydrogenase (short-subunit alcohol dehydrogenase family)
MGADLDELASFAPAGQPASPEEIASAVVYLASDEASFIHGGVLAVDGGRTATGVEQRIAEVRLSASCASRAN